MSTLIHGPAYGTHCWTHAQQLLTFAQRAEVLARFVHRWTYGGKCPACKASPLPAHVCGEDLPDGPNHAPLTSDAQWLADHAFYITKGGHLDQHKEHCEPAYMADLT